MEPGQGARAKSGMQMHAFRHGKTATGLAIKFKNYGYRPAGN
jgi:hypothetical protein